MGTLQKGDDIAQRLLAFAAGALGITARIRKDPSGRHIAGQLVRSATAAGANYEEARAAESRADFIHKVSVAAKEMREACYWIELVAASGLLSATETTALVNEGNQLGAILGASARTAKQRAAAEDSR